MVTAMARRGLSGIELSSGHTVKLSLIMSAASSRQYSPTLF